MARSSGRLFRDSISLSLGDSSVFRFWHDSWEEGSVRLKSRFPRLFSLSSQKSGVCVFSESDNIWFFKWERFFNFNELLEFLDLWSVICRRTPCSDSRDSWKWSGSSDGLFKTKRCTRSLLSRSRLQKILLFLGQKFGGKLFQ